MRGKASEKIAGGKLVRCEVELDNSGVASEVKFTGDFFLHPENTLAEVEAYLVGSRVCGKTSEPFIANSIESFLLFRKAELTGASPEAFAKVLKQAMG